MLIERLVTLPGLTLMNAPGKTGKTLLGAQLGMSVAAGVSVFDYYKVLTQAPVLFVEKDDPAGATSIQDILNHTKIPMDGQPFITVDTQDAQQLTLGPAFILWLDQVIPSQGFKLVVLDSYTALRGIRQGGGDIVKVEATDLLLLDQIAKKHGTAILLLHHYSKGSVNHDWSERAAGTYAMAAASEAQIVMNRFPDLASNATERLVRVRGRHFEGTDMVLRLRPETLSYEHLIEGAAAPFYPDLLSLRSAFQVATFSPKSISQELGMARATAHRLIGRLLGAGAIRKAGYGEYVLAVSL